MGLGVSWEGCEWKSWSLLVCPPCGLMETKDMDLTSLGLEVRTEDPNEAGTLLDFHPHGG